MTLRPLNPFRPFDPFRYGVRSITAAIRALFANGEQGWWYDPSDLSTLYQDAAGTTPVTAMEQNVGLILDKSKGLQLGPELVTNGDFSQGATGWTTDPGWSIAGGAATCNGSTGFLRSTIPTPPLEIGKWYSVSMRLVSYTSGNVYLPYDGTGFVALPSNTPGIYRGVFYCDNLARPIVYGASFNGSITNISVRELPENHAYQTALTKRMKVSRRVNLLVGTSTLATQSITTVAGGHTFKFSGAGSVTLSGTATGTYSAGTHSITCTAGTLTVTVTGAVTDASFVPTIKAHLPYQLVNTVTDYDDDPAKFPTYELLDGIDDSASSSAGGGGTTGFFFSAAVEVGGGAGANRTLFSDAGTNTGYIVRFNTSNQLEFAAGNGTAYTTIATAGTLAVGALDIVQAWDDGTNLNVRIGSGSVASIARPTVSAGTAATSIGQDNGASTGYFNGRIYSQIYRRDSAPSQSLRDSVLTYQRQKAKMP